MTMADVVSPAKRSRMMSGIKGKNSLPEHLHAEGLRTRHAGTSPVRTTARTFRRSALMPAASAWGEVKHLVVPAEAFAPPWCNVV
jgi:hypothetical protein